MSRIRSSMILLGIAVIALLIGLLRLLTQAPVLPAGSSFSTDASGAKALFDWASAAGASPLRFVDPTAGVAQTGTAMLVLQPERPIDEASRTVLDTVPQRGGTLFVAGDSIAWVVYVRTLGITVEPVRPATMQVSTRDGSLTFSTVARYRLRAAAAEPLLSTPDGDWLALHMPYRGGSLIVLATPEPLLNGALQDDTTARFVFRQLIAPAIGSGLVFDEVPHASAPPLDTATAPVTSDELLFNTAPGRAVLYAAALVFAYLVLSGRRIGPALPTRPPAEVHRTMFEHVQMVADLYRRARQLRTVKAAFADHYARELGRTGLSSARSLALSRAVTRIEAARSEADLVDAVGAASDAG